MDSLELAVATIIGIFRWIFRSLGGKRVASILSLLSFPFLFFSSVSTLVTGPSINAADVGTIIVMWSISGLLSAASLYAIWQTEFFNRPISAFSGVTNTSAWISIIGGYILLVLLFGIFILTVMIIAAGVSAVSSSLGGGTRR